MSDAFFPYEPLNELKPFGDNVWIVDGHEVRLRSFGLRIPFPTRMTIVRLPDGALWIHSPVAADDALYSEVEARGTVAYLVAPNTLHWSYMGGWRNRFPKARIHIVPGLEAKVAEPRAVLDSGLVFPWATAIDWRLVQGPALTEAVFFHGSSRTLILTDLIENFEPARVRSRFWRQAMRFAGAVDPDGKSPIDMQWSFFRHRKLLRDVVQQMIDWAPERIVLSHGRCYEENGVAELRRAFRWAIKRSGGV